ncbi:hypothetical protein ACPESN_14705 [Stutzerimonas marianensis]|uniref:hypothetical protein n=1 Tax=Stutzerimonas marianensis TaxID=2929513 RepID=UPI003C2D7928
MDATVLLDWETDRLSARDDSSLSSWRTEAMERDVSLLLPQLVAALEYSAALVEASTDGSASRLSAARGALRTTVDHFIRRRRLLLAN